MEDNEEMTRYIVGRQRVVWKYKWQGPQDKAWVASDSDWGGTERDRKSTSGGSVDVRESLYQHVELVSGSLRT